MRLCGICKGVFFFSGEIMTEIFDSDGLRRAIVRLAHEIEEKNKGLNGLVLAGIKRGGEIVARRIQAAIAEFSGIELPCAGLDIGMKRDDLVTGAFVPAAQKNVLGFAIDGKRVVLCDDVLYTGRSAAAAIETLFSLGRPQAIELLALVDRGGRQLPVRADFVGKNVPTAAREYVEVCFTELGAERDALSISSGRKKC